MTCKNCGSINTSIGETGYIAPFFIKRVFSLDLCSLGEMIEERTSARNSLKKTIASISYGYLQKIPAFKKLFQFISPVRCKIVVCRECGFVGPEASYSYEMLSGLYCDYRSDTYNKDRCRYEPDYKFIQDLVGKDPDEVRLRLKNIDNLLSMYLEASKISSVLDWGGGEGRFIPSILNGKQITVLDVSNEPLADSTYQRISNPVEGVKYDYIQICHVFEHMSNPLDFLKNIVEFLSEDGFLYIEVPQDRSDFDIEKFKTHPNKASHFIHEHLNLYSQDAVLQLGKAAGLTEVSVYKLEMDFGWKKANIVSGLFQKKHR